MKIYMGYSHTAGPAEGAVLIFANTVREAKKLAFNTYLNDYCDGEWTDIRATLIKGCDWLWKEKRKEIPHVVDCPKACDHCNTWGNSEIGEDGLCDDCREEMNDLN
jgi:hypothetical protein